jgi:hypothetical protein
MGLSYLKTAPFLLFVKAALIIASGTFYRIRY